MHQVIIIGGGIGGMTLLAALQRVDIEAHLYEQAPVIGEVGAGIALWPNARFSLEQIGAAAQIIANARPLHCTEVLSRRGEVLNQVNFAQAWPDLPDASFHVVHRADLLAAIAAQAPASHVHTGHRLVDVDATAKQVQVRFANGFTATGTMLVGADGIHSVVRRHVVPPDRDAMRYSGQTCFRGIAHLSLRSPEVMREIEGAGERCGICPLSGDRVYWWAAYNAPEGAMLPQAERQAALLHRYAGWPAQIEAVIAATPAEEILQNDLCDRAPVGNWSKGSITLLGDAAHPTTPNLGQGANMAIDDAIVLARALRESSSLPEVFDRYEASRLVRTRMIVERSWLWGRLARWQSPVAVWTRDFLARHTPRSVVSGELRRQVIDRVPPLVPDAPSS